MKAISKDRKCIALFESGVWKLKDKKILLITNHDEVAITFAEYGTEKEAIKEFELFMNHACNVDVFDFSENH